MQEATELCIKALRKVVDQKLSPKLVDVARIEARTKRVEMLSVNELAKLLGEK